MFTYQVAISDGVNGDFRLWDDFLKEVYTDANEAAVDFIRLVKATENRDEYVSVVAAREGWHRDYELKQNQRYQVELRKWNEDKEIQEFTGEEFTEESKALLEPFSYMGWIGSPDFYNPH